MAVRYGFSTALKSARAERDERNARGGQVGQQVLNALLGMATAYVTGGVGSALGTQLMGGGAATAAGALAPSAANVIPALNVGVSALPEEMGAVKEGLKQPIASLKEKFAQDLLDKKWAELQAANKGLVPGKVTFGKEGDVTRTLEQPKVISSKLKAPTDLSEAGQIAYRGVIALNNTGKTDEAIRKLKEVTDITEAEKTFIASKIQRKWKPTGKQAVKPTVKPIVIPE